MTAITPEIIRTNLAKEQKVLNIKLKRIENKQTYNKYDNRNITNNTTTINNEQKGFLRFIVDILLLPFVIPYSIIHYIYIKYDIKGSLKANKEYEDFIRKRHQTIKKVNNIQRWNE